MGLSNDIQSVLLTQEQLQSRVAQLGAQITRDYAGRENILLVCVLRGAYIFASDLSRAIDLPLKVDFMAASSYGSGTVSSGQVKIKKDIDQNLKDCHVILVEDILDTGNTLYYLTQVLRDRGAASVAVCALLDKPERRTKPISADYAGFQVPDAFVVGYGLDYDEKYRNLPYIGVLKPQIYES